MPLPAQPFARPLYVMLKPVGARCNLACEYCYYLGKGTGKGAVLSDELLELFIRQYMEAQTMPQVLFTWHGGEPLLRPISFYQKALALQRRYANGRQVDNCIQTNGTLLTDEWCRFLRDNNFLVGISIDGPQHLHDHYRVGTSKRAKASEVVVYASKRAKASLPSWHRVMRGIDLLKKHGVEWNAMATVNHINASHPFEFYHFFRDICCEFLQFTPVVERIATHDSEHAHTTFGGVAHYSVTPGEWGSFLCGVYDEWVKQDVGEIFVQTFDATLANWVGEPPGVCSLSPFCGHAVVMETDGTVYSCDHFVFPEHRLGNIRQQTLTSLVYGEQQRTFGRNKSDALPRQCRECQWHFACHGECPRNRFTNDRYGNPGLNYLCHGYQQFFTHVAADMDFMAAELRAGCTPANIMLRDTIFHKNS